MLKGLLVLLGLVVFACVAGASFMWLWSLLFTSNISFWVALGFVAVFTLAYGLFGGK